MKEITQQEFEDNFDSYMDEVEKKKSTFLIKLPDGRGVIMAPVDEDLKELIDVNRLEITDYD
jgi:PHD/YefM family antitoxin component YafN of YafNO toxin-antitoxin module